MNRKRKSAHRRTISVLLTVCMLIACLPLNALSAGEPPAAGSAALPPAETSNIEESSEVCIVEEDLSKRGEYEKHFLCSDGTYIAVTYAEPVHYLDADGAWADTDVALSLNTASSRYEAQSGGFAVSFASAYSASAQQPAAVSMTDGAFPVSWTTAVAGTLLPAAGRSGLQASASFDALVPYTPSVSVLTAQQSQAASLQSFAGRPAADADSFAAPDRISVAQYTGIAQTAGQSAGVSLRYSVSQHRIKEDIIIADKSAVTDFVTTLDIGALTAAPQDDGSVLLTDGNGDTVYTVGVPYLYDAEYNVSYDVEVTVSQTGSVCRITYSPDREWMFSDERVYPVVLDPTITSGEYAANIVDTYVTQADSNNHSGEGNLVVGIKSGKINRAYIKINNLPSLPDDVVPLSANLTIKHGANTTTGRTMSLYYAGSSWSPSSITYANQPTSFTTIASCAFNTSNVSFDFDQSKLTGLYNLEFAAMHYGFMLRYSSESTTNPDYNMLRSMEYPTASEKPCFTVRYGYSLPTGLATRIIYSFKNAGSVKYLDVSGGTDADNTNVIQYTGNDTAAQQFKLELSSTGNGYILRSQVGGKTRVLDIYKTNGRVENGNNVQIYRNVDPIAQEWLIIPVSQFYYKIVPRSNPALALTSYGSSNGSSTGKSTTSAGNVFVSTYTGNSQNQWWIIEKQDATVIQPGYPPIADGEYYLNSINTSKYIRNLSGSVRSESGTIASLGSSIKWKFTNMGGKYLIQPMNNTSLYLAGGTSTIEDTVSLIEIDGEIPSRCLWTVSRQPTSNRLTIKSHLYRTLCGNDTSLSTEIYPTCDDEWRFVAVDEMNELTTMSLNVDELECYKDENIYITEAAGCTFISGNDLEYQLLSANPSSCINLTDVGVRAYVTTNSVGTASIKVTNKVANISETFNINISQYKLTVGLSTDNYNAGCQYGTRNSSTYGGEFYNGLTLSNNNMQKVQLWHQNSANGQLPSASKDDFRYENHFVGEIADSSDFMIYIGHGIAANREGNLGGNGNDRNKGNFLHYNYDTNGNSHSGTNNCTGDGYNLYTSEAEFGSSTSRLRWVWLYTCNFLNTNDYVSDDDLKQMMNGAHIVMGYSTQAYLCSDVSEIFAQKLSYNNRYIIDSFFIAGDQAESEHATDNHIQKVLYIDETRYETINTPPVRYNYSASDVRIITNGIHDNIFWE